jgi:dihydroorotate dehydrogenase (NAD+) catalytic subunit
MEVRPRPGTDGAPAAVDLRVEVAGLELRNPVVTASGTFASGREYADFFDLSRLGAVVTKGVSLEPWAGNDSPRIAETASGMLNSIGLQNPGLDAFVAGDLAWLEGRDVPVIVNVSGHTVADYAAVAERLDAHEGVDALEVNISCPNVDAGGMAFGTDCVSAAEVTSACRAVTAKPLIVKLSPNVTDIAEIARAVESAGADAVSLINTLLGMSIDARTRRPRLARVVGGLSGPAIKPVALRMVWQVYRAVQVPIVGMGGIMSGEDAVEFMLAGASAVAVGTASFVDPRAALQVVDGIAEYCRENGVARVAELVGALEE